MLEGEPFSTPSSLGTPMTPDITPAEKGFSGPDAKPVDPQGLPPAGHQWAVPHFGTFGARYNTIARAYLQRFDEAVKNSRENAWRMRMDPVIDGCLEIRATPTALLDFSLAPQDPEDPAQVAAAKRQEALIRNIPRFVELKRWLLKEGAFVGRAGAQTLYSWVRTAPRLMAAPTDFRPVNGDKLQFRWDGTPGIVVGAGSSLWFHEQTEQLDTNRVYFLNPDERQGVIVHRSYAEDPDHWHPEFAGAVHGTGLRGRLYWLWAMKSQVWGMSMDFLRWFAKGLMVYYFEHGNQAHQNAITQWVQNQDGNDAMLYPVFRDREGNPYFQKPIERFEVSTASPQFLQQLITQYFDDLIRFCILHNSLTTGTAATGLGSGVASAHQTTKDELVKLDATMLDATLSQDLVTVMYRCNEPGIPPARYVSSVDNPNVQQLLEGAQAIVAMGGSVSQEPLLDAVGLPAPKQDDTILGGPQPQQPAAVTEIPDNTPMVSGDPSGQQPVQ